MPAPTTPQLDLWTRIESLCDAAIRISAEHELSRLLQEVVDSARDVIGARYAALGVLHADRQHLETFITSGLSKETAERIGNLPVGKGILGLLIQDPRPIRLARLQDHPKSVGVPDGHPPMSSFLGVPIKGRHGPIGNLYLTEKIGATEFSEDDQSIAVMLAGHAGIAVENARLFEEREQLLANLQAMQQSRARFFAMVNHELRNAITAIFGWTELWLRKYKTEDPPRAAVEVHESSERAVRLLDDFLDLSRMDASKLTLHPEQCDALAIAAAVINELEPTATRRAVSLELVTTREIPCTTDRLRVRQILINLLTNAIRHSPEGGAVRIQLSTQTDRVEFEVIDSGDGIPISQLATIFEAFERAGKENDRGTGLGLTLSRHLARLLGGDLTADSRPGKGATFTLTIPQTR